MYDVGMHSLEQDGTKRSKAVMSQYVIILSLILSVLHRLLFFTLVLKVREKAVGKAPAFYLSKSI